MCQRAGSCGAAPPGKALLPVCGCHCHMKAFRPLAFDFLIKTLVRYYSAKQNCQEHIWKVQIFNYCDMVDVLLYGVNFS